jgi:hypothetical protein
VQGHAENKAGFTETCEKRLKSQQLHSLGALCKMTCSVFAGSSVIVNFQDIICSHDIGAELHFRTPAYWHPRVKAHLLT